MKVSVAERIVDDVIVKTLFIEELVLTGDSKDKTRLSELKEALENQKSNSSTIECLYFENCRFIDFPILPKDYFKSVQYLHAVDCGIKTVSHEALAQFENIEGLFLEGNNIIDFPYRQLVFFSKLRVCSFGKDHNAPENMKVLLGKWTEKETVFESLVSGSIETIMESLGENSAKVENDSTEIDSFMLSEVQCEQIPSTDEDPAEVVLSVPSHLYKAAYASDALKDFTITVDNTVFKVHRVVLASHSGKMMKVFQKFPQAKNLTLFDVSPDAVQICITFMYTGELPNRSSLKSETLYPIAMAAENLGIDGMCDFANNALKCMMNPKVVVDVLRNFRSERLKNTAFEFVERLLPDKKLCPSLKKNPEAVQVILKVREQLVESERKQMELTVEIRDLNEALDTVIENNRDGDVAWKPSQEEARKKELEEQIIQRQKNKLAKDHYHREQMASTSTQPQEAVSLSKPQPEIDESVAIDETFDYDSDTVSEISKDEPIDSDGSFEITDMPSSEASRQSCDLNASFEEIQIHPEPVADKPFVCEKIDLPVQRSIHGKIQIFKEPSTNDVLVLVPANSGREANCPLEEVD